MKRNKVVKLVKSENALNTKILAIMFANQIRNGAIQNDRTTKVS